MLYIAKVSYIDDFYGTGIEPDYNYFKIVYKNIGFEANNKQEAQKYMDKYTKKEQVDLEKLVEVSNPATSKQSTFLSKYSNLNEFEILTIDKEEASKKIGSIIEIWENNNRYDDLNDEYSSLEDDLHMQYDGSGR